jgi:hypothetical protein
MSKKKVVQRTQKEVYEKWIKALRGGGYNQAEGRLKVTSHKPSYCCLGVLCQLSVNDGGGYKEHLEGMGTLPDNMLHWMGMSGENQAKLIDLNDDGTSFKDIANYIETFIAPRALKRISKRKGNKQY